jgi:hypothetical protein
VGGGREGRREEGRKERKKERKTTEAKVLKCSQILTLQI